MDAKRARLSERISSHVMEHVAHHVEALHHKDTEFQGKRTDLEAENEDTAATTSRKQRNGVYQKQGFQLVVRMPRNIGR